MNPPNIFYVFFQPIQNISFEKGEVSKVKLEKRNKIITDDREILNYE